jgi:TIR domain
MSDIFISYSKMDHALALKLSAFLEAEGWSVWWDKSLGAADLYRDEIMKQLAAARAVITIWTENSVKSDWVRAEAGRAKADGKLIPVKTADVAYADIPLPFGEMHTENVGSTDLIRAAIVSLLSKPTAPQSPFWQITALFRYHILTWIGIIGTAITLFTTLKDALDLAGWARELVAHWQEWTQVFWGWVFSLFQVKIPREFVPIITFSAFTVVLVAGVNISSSIGGQSVRSKNAISVTRRVYIFGGGLLIYLVTMVIVAYAIDIVLSLIPDEYTNISLINRMEVLALAIAQVVPIGHLLYFLRERSWVLTASLLFLAMSVCLLFVPLFFEASSDASTAADESILSALALLQISWMTVIIFSPLQQLVRRLSFVVLGVITLVALSEISKVNLHQYLQPPKVSDNSLR